MKNRVIYFEIPSDDPENSTEFFKKVFGWEFRRFQSPNYWQAMTGDPKNPGIDGGITKKSENFTRIINTIEVDNIDETLALLEKMGGKIVSQKTHTQDVGWLAQFSDPDGNYHGLVQFDNPAGMTGGLVIERHFRAPLKSVWQNWALPQNLMRWWGPKEYISTEAIMDFQEGGKYIFSMRSPEGKDFYSTGIYKEIVPMKKIVATDSFSDKEGNIVPASYYGLDGDELEQYLVTITFKEEGPTTTMTLKHEGLPEDMKKLTKQGWEQSFDKFADSLKI
ncbi:MAG: SRPBCC domain-containing protein [Bacillota bacterium]